MKIKLISWNIWHGRYLDKAIEFLKKEQADVVCLQEVAESGWGLVADEELNIHQELMRGIGVKGAYRRMFWGKDESGRWDMGVAIYSKCKVLDTVTYSFEAEVGITVEDPSVTSVIPRVLLGQLVEFGGIPLWVFTTHFTITPKVKVTEKQLGSAYTVKRFLQKYDRYMLCGDMNTSYGNETYKILSEGLVDVTDAKQTTLHPTIHKVGYKGYHVDYVFYKGEGIRHLSTNIPVVDASDHLPVVCEFEIG